MDWTGSSSAWMWIWWSPLPPSFKIVVVVVFFFSVTHVFDFLHLFFSLFHLFSTTFVFPFVFFFFGPCRSTSLAGTKNRFSTTKKSPTSQVFEFFFSRFRSRFSPPPIRHVSGFESKSSENFFRRFQEDGQICSWIGGTAARS